MAVNWLVMREKLRSSGLPVRFLLTRRRPRFAGTKSVNAQLRDILLRSVAVLRSQRILTRELLTTALTILLR
jgi:hypothetical protein